MWKVMICDDEPPMCAQLRELLLRFAGECGETLHIEECYSARSLLCRLTEDCDILFLDIKMDEMDGIQAARALRARNNDICLIFSTTMVQYALEGYQVHAFGFLTKPLNYAQLRLQMIDALRLLRGKKREYISLKVGREVRRLAVADLSYVEVYGHTVRLAGREDALDWNGTLQEMEELLKPYPFFRCHKSYLVNLEQIARVGAAQVQLKDGRCLPLSKYRKKELLEAFAAYLGGKI